jgi:hypothetical protein
MVPYQAVRSDPIALPPRQPDGGYVRPPLEEQTFVPQVFKPKEKKADKDKDKDGKKKKDKKDEEDD